MVVGVTMALKIKRVFEQAVPGFARTAGLALLLAALVFPASVAAEAEREASAKPPLDPDGLQLASVSALVAPLGEEQPLYAKRADWVVPIASITKLMTAMIVLDSGASLDQWLTVKPRHYPAPANAYSRIRPESEATRRDLLQIALMSSENRAAYLLARHHPEGYEAFIDAMNDKAQALGMTRTRFVDSTGLSDDNVSTASDLLKLVNAAHAYESIRSASTQTRRDVRFRSPGYQLIYGNTNRLVHRSRWDLGLSKTGYLDASGRCLVMVVDLEGEPTVMVLLDSFGRSSPLGDAGRVRRWLETGRGGSVARSALRYERDKAQQLQAGREKAVSLSESVGLEQ